jgi:hypothetical protein
MAGVGGWITWLVQPAPLHKTKENSEYFSYLILGTYVYILAASSDSHGTLELAHTRN